MGQCFVLRNNEGKAIGYIQQVEHTIRYGIQIREDLKQCQLYLVDQNSLVRKKALKPHGGEQEWYEEGCVIKGGCLLQDGAVIASTSEDAKNCLMRYLAHVPKRKFLAKTESEREKPVRTVCNENIRFQRNWPPNPCNPEAE